MQRHQLEVHALNERPNHPVRLQRRPVALIQLILRAATFHDGHAAEEDEEVGAGEDGLVAGDAGEDLGVLVLEDDFVLEELEPGRCCWAEDCCGSSWSACIPLYSSIFPSSGSLYFDVEISV